jgi:hypothetical protein
LFFIYRLEIIFDFLVYFTEKILIISSDVANLKKKSWQMPIGKIFSKFMWIED